jgi:hypothetical protein
MDPMIGMTLLFITALALPGQDFSKLQVQEVATGFPGGEGPVWSRHVGRFEECLAHSVGRDHNVH